MLQKFILKRRMGRYILRLNGVHKIHVYGINLVTAYSAPKKTYAIHEQTEHKYIGKPVQHLFTCIDAD